MGCLCYSFYVAKYRDYCTHFHKLLDYQSSQTSWLKVRFLVFLRLKPDYIPARPEGGTACFSTCDINNNKDGRRQRNVLIQLGILDSWQTLGAMILLAWSDFRGIKAGNETWFQLGYNLASAVDIKNCTLTIWTFYPQQPPHETSHKASLITPCRTQD